MTGAEGCAERLQEQVVVEKPWATFPEAEEIGTDEGVVAGIRSRSCLETFGW